MVAANLLCVIVERRRLRRLEIEQLAVEHIEAIEAHLRQGNRAVGAVRRHTGRARVAVARFRRKQALRVV